MILFTGKRLGQNKYVIEEELGRGGFGITYKAANTVLDQIVVIKTLNSELRQDPNFLNHQQQFQAEARRLAKCVHPSIVRVNDFFVEDGLPFIVMDYVPGQTLDRVVLPDKPLPEAIALHYIRQVGDAVSTIHQNGLLHRDIKPQNLILRAGTQQVVLIDFGIAREFTPGLIQTHTHLASEGYAPIEQYLPQATRSAATDIYGLAATLYTLLTGKVPIPAPLRDRSPLPELRQLQPGVSALINEAVMRGMAMEPQHRPATVDAWLSLLPDAGQTRPATPLAGSTTQVATVAVAPAYRPASSHYAQSEMAVPASPAQLSETRARRWLPGLIVLGTVLPLALGYFWWRSHATLPTGQSTPVDGATPSVTPETDLSSPADTTRSPAPSSSVESGSAEETPQVREPSPPSSPTDQPLFKEKVNDDKAANVDDSNPNDQSVNSEPQPPPEESARETPNNPEEPQPPPEESAEATPVDSDGQRQGEASTGETQRRVEEQSGQAEKRHSEPVGGQGQEEGPDAGNNSVN